VSREHRNPRVDAFVQTATASLPGVLYGFNIADLKRRNVHLGFTHGDGDIKDLAAALGALPSAIVARTHGDRWLVLIPESAAAHASIIAEIDGFARVEPFELGFAVHATRDGQKTSKRTVVRAKIARAVRCLYTRVRTQQEVEEAAKRIEAEDHGLPVNRPIALDEIASMKREPWRCVSRYPEEKPACPSCGGDDFEITEVDGGIYTGSGECTKCRASIEIRDASSL
jgi:hypothetical protein